ncbi:MAG: hypothetical protein ABI461_16250 [Polyangiaceae bacterium]
MPKKSTKRTPSHSTKAKISKAAFVRSISASTPAKEVVAKAKAEGIMLTDAYVYNVRATWRAAKVAPKKTAPREKGARPRAKRGGAVTVRLRGARGVEDLLRAVAAELGLVRAIGVLEAEHRRVRRLLGH